MWPPTIKQIESIGWELESSHDFGYFFKWKKDTMYWNCPTLFIGIKEGYHQVRISKFTGHNDWYGKMENVFLGKCRSVKDLRMICNLVSLDHYTKFKK